MWRHLGEEERGAGRGWKGRREGQAGVGAGGRMGEGVEREEREGEGERWRGEVETLGG